MSSGNIGKLFFIAIIIILVGIGGLILIGIAIGKKNLWLGIGGIVLLGIAVSLYLAAH